MINSSLPVFKNLNRSEANKAILSNEIWPNPFTYNRKQEALNNKVEILWKFLCYCFDFVYCCVLLLQTSAVVFN